ncbi:MAG TPA: hypothetical protein VLG92_03670 [Candidatus Saccharimonadia bacterium]|nr:hypothetical protein [Candidatus Saccharimonadia bacterium]
MSAEIFEEFKGSRLEIITPDPQLLVGRLAIANTAFVDTLDLGVTDMYRPDAVVPDPSSIRLCTPEEEQALLREGSIFDVTLPSQIFIMPGSYEPRTSIERHFVSIYGPEPADYRKLQLPGNPKSMNFRPAHMLTTTHRQHAKRLEGLHLDRSKATMGPDDWSEAELDYGSRIGVNYRGQAGIWLANMIITPAELRDRERVHGLVRVLTGPKAKYNLTSGMVVHDGTTLTEVGDAALDEAKHGFAENPEYYKQNDDYMVKAEEGDPSISAIGFYFFKEALWQRNRARAARP